MSHNQPPPWEPDLNKMGNWRSMFEQTRRPDAAAAPAPSPVETPEEAPEADDLAIDPTVYKPLVLQRGRSRPAMMLELRRYEPRSGLWSSWAMSYPSLYAVDLTGDRLLTLDFGARQFVIEGRGLDKLVRQIREGTAVGIVEHSAGIWPAPMSAVVVTAIRQIKV